MPDESSILELRYTLPGLGYLITTYVCIALFIPSTLRIESVWVALSAIALVGVVPIGYLVQQPYLFWNHVSGGTAHIEHIQQLGNVLRSYSRQRSHRKISLSMNGDKIGVDARELSSELKRLGKEYLRRKMVWRNKKYIETNGYLTPLHDIIFKGIAIHEKYRLGAWMHARITRSLTLAIILAILPWTMITVSVQVILWIIAIEFIAFVVIGWPVSKWSRIDDDLNEQFLTWLWHKGN